MRALLQRVSSARVTVAGETVGEIAAGLLVFLGLDKGDDEAAAARLLDKLLAYRVFADDQGRMNRSVTDINGGVLLVSQFTLSADTRKGLRPELLIRHAPRRSRGALQPHSGQPAGAPPRCRRWPVWRRYAGQPHQRRPGDFFVGKLTSCPLQLQLVIVASVPALSRPLL